MENFWTLFIPWAVAIALLTCVAFFFTDESCLPHKRKMEKMLETIRSYERRNDLTCVEIDHKGKHFKVDVGYISPEWYVSYYNVSINGKLVKTFYILEHVFSKSRRDQHHGDMREYEEYEIIATAYKFVKRANNDSFKQRWDKSSYFN